MTPASSPLAGLNAYIRGVTRQGQDGELASAVRFRRSWEAGRTLDRLQQAIANAPANAGPLNSHALVARALGLTGELSTHYLRRLLVQVETLQWLEAAREQFPRPAAAKAARRARKRK